MPLTGKQRRYLRALAHPLEPVVLMGQRGLSDALMRQVAECLASHELIKVRLAPECPLDRAAAAAELAERTKSEVAGAIGRVIILYRARTDDPSIRLPSPQRTEAPE